MLIDWINDELADFRIIVKDLEEDLFDGQILQKLIGMWLMQYMYKVLTVSWYVAQFSFDLVACLVTIMMWSVNSLGTGISQPV